MSFFENLGVKISDFFNSITGGVSSDTVRETAQALAAHVDGTIEEEVKRKGTVWTIESEIDGRKLEAVCWAGSSPYVELTLHTIDQASRDVYFMFGYIHDELGDPSRGYERLDLSNRVYLEWFTDTAIPAREVIDKVPRESLELLASLGTATIFFCNCNGKNFDLRVPFDAVPEESRDQAFRALLSVSTNLIAAVEAWPPSS